MKKRIVIDGAIFGLQKAGGISRLWAEILLYLDEKAKEECKVFFLIPKNSNVEWATLSKELQHIKVVKRRRFKNHFFIDSLYLTFLAFWLRPHIWHCSYYVGFPTLFSGKKVVTCHDMISEIFKDEDRLKFLSLKKSDAILAISKNTESDLYRIWPKFKGKSQVIYNFVRKVSEGKRQAPPYFLYLGRRGGYKNFLPTVEEILRDSRFNEYKIAVVGGEKLNGEEKELAKSDRITVFETLSFEKVERMIQGATLLLFPSLYEGFGMPIIEAFSAGVPVLAFNTSSIPEVVGPSYPLVEGKEVGDTLERLLREREKWSAYGKERAECFNEKNTLEKLYDFYKGT